MRRTRFAGLLRKPGFCGTESGQSGYLLYPDGDYASFIRNYTGNVPAEGNFVDRQGKILGRHKGMIHYTVGQRKGLGIALGYPAFVLEIRPKTNEIVLGNDEESLTTTVRAHLLNAMGVEHFDEMEGSSCLPKFAIIIGADGVP